ncbi:MAG: hypothetical protein ACR2QW_15050, partial [bacterium]
MSFSSKPVKRLEIVYSREQEPYMPEFATRKIPFKHLFPLIFVISLFSGCAWVKTTPAAEKVRLVPADRVNDCEKLGDLSTYTKA